MDNKNFMTYEEQISFLQKEKHLIIDNPQKALSLLKQYSYFTLINGYKSLFKKADGTYKDKTRIEDIYYLFAFDISARNLLINSIMEVELHIKSLLSYSFCEKYGNSEKAYLVATNYNYNNHTYQSEINELIGKLTEVLKKNNTYGYMKHQRDKHGNVPLWVLVKGLTLGNVSKMYSCLTPDIQTKISKEFEGVTEENLATFLDMLTRFRNVCAHNERLFNYKCNRKCIDDMDIHKKLNIEKRNNRYIKGKSDLFAVIIALKYLLSEEKFAILIDNLVLVINDLFEKTAQIQRPQLYKIMGFPANWVDIKNL